jgi:hypothetical protein
MKPTWAVGCAALLAATPVLAQQTVTVERAPDGYVLRTRETFPDGTTGTGELRLPSVPGLLQGFVADVKSPSPQTARKDLTVLAHCFRERPSTRCLPGMKDWRWIPPRTRALRAPQS